MHHARDASFASPTKCLPQDWPHALTASFDSPEALSTFSASSVSANTEKWGRPGVQTVRHRGGYW